MATKKIPIRPELLDGIKELCENNTEILLVSLATIDGFSIKSFASRELNAEADKLAAMSSTISALSDSSAQQLLQGQFDTTIVEAAAGNILFIRTTYLGLPSVLMLAARTKMTLATARYKTKGLAQAISVISE